jgi:hypothetical protein
MFPLMLIVILFLLLLAQAGVMKAVRKVGAGRSMTTGYPFDPFDPQRLR